MRRGTEEDGWDLCPFNCARLIIKQSSDIHQTISKFSAEVAILDHLLKAIKGERDDILKINLLVLLQEYTSYFMEDDPKGRLEKVCSSLNSILSTQGDVNNAVMFQVKCQVLITFTTMFIDQLVIKSQPKVFESFVEALLDMVSKVNSGPDRLLRATACQCLQEFELCYPGVLSACLARLFQASLAENSHVSQSYVTLFTTAFQHAAQLFEVDAPANPNIPAPGGGSGVFGGGGSGVFKHSLPRSFSASQLVTSSLSLVMPDTPAGPFVIPPNTRYGPSTEATSNIPEFVAKEVHRGISMLVEQSVMLNEWGLAALTELLVPFVNLAHLPPTLLRHPNFYRLMFVNQPLFFHQLLYLAILFPDVYAADHALIISRIIMMMRDILLPLEQRMLAINWLIALTRPDPSPPFPISPSLSGSSNLSPPLSLSSSHISPPISPTYTHNSSTSVMAPTFTTPPTLPPLLFEHFRTFYPTVFDSLDLKEAKLHALLKCFSNDPPSAAPPKNFLEVLQCLDDFRFFQPESRQASIVFSHLYRTLTHFPHLLSAVYDFCLHTIRTRPHFLFNLIRLIDALAHAHAQTHGTQNTSPLVLRMLENFEKVLCALAPRKLNAYLALAERIVMEAQIDPTGILVAIRNYLRVVPDGHWGHGQVLLCIARWALLRHQKMNVFKPLGELLSFMASFYPDIEIRDRAQFYLLMLTHLPPEKITLVLTQQNTPTDEENVGFVSPFILKAKTVRSLPKFLSLTRVYASQPDIELDDSQFVPPETEDPFTIYTAYINSPSLSIVINIPFELSYKYPPLNEVFPKKVYALLVQFTPNLSYETLAPLRIPYLAMTEDRKPTAGGFPYLYKLVLKFRPKYPLPGIFSVKTLFNDGDGKTCKGEIEPVSVNFQDLYMEAPVPPSVTTPKGEFLRLLFDSLWKATSAESNKECMKSVKFLEIPHSNMLKALAYLKRFIIEEPAANGSTPPTNNTTPLSPQQNQNNNNNNNTTNSNRKSPPDLDKKVFVCQKRALLFLPTKFHVIMKFMIYEDQTLVKIRTDFWKILSFIDAFFSVMLGM